MKKTVSNQPHLERIPESLSGESETKTASVFNGKRVSIATLMNSLQRQDRPGREEGREGVEASKVEEKGRMIKELQQEILEKKLKNDMIQEAFHRRHEAEPSNMNYSQALAIIFSACKLLAAQNGSFKRAYMRSMLTIFKQSGKNRQKAIKSLLIWTISWITRLFTFLSSTLIKK
jgi:hypothetical protein